MNDVELIYNLLTEDELQYIHNLINNQTMWVPRHSYDGIVENTNGKLFYDSITPNHENLINYHKLICENEKFIVEETAVNIITKDRFTKNNRHFDGCDCSYVTYFGGDFKGGLFFYYNDKNQKFTIKPEKGLSLKINKGVVHEVEEVTEGVRFSLYTFLKYKQKVNKSII